MNKNTVIIRVDGGICSQIAFVALGLWLCDRYPGLTVKYDLSWFKSGGTDLNGRFVRNWDFPKVFPSLMVEEALEAECAWYSKHFVSEGTCVDTFAPPLYVGGYPNLEPVLYRMAARLRVMLTLDPDAASRDVLSKMENGSACAVHVRRGDLSVPHPVYGAPASVDYFVKATRIVSALDPDALFFFFSDEPDWVRSEILPRLPSGLRVYVVEGHGSDCGYQDLFLISRCRHVISSSGSLGVVGALLAQDLRTLVVNRNREWAFKEMKNVIYINDTYHVFEVKPRVRGVCKLLQWLGKGKIWG